MAMAGTLTTHVLDIMHGRPAAGMEIEVWRLGRAGDEPELLTGTHTGEDGRPVVSLVADGGLAVGSYELVFAVGTYFAALGADLPEPPFLDRVAVRFGIADPEAQYHVPLLVSPWAYSTYRGG
jgi:5-hydroxyisourate hydrolase